MKRVLMFDFLAPAVIEFDTLPRADTEPVLKDDVAKHIPRSPTGGRFGSMQTILAAARPSRLRPSDEL